MVGMVKVPTPTPKTRFAGGGPHTPRKIFVAHTALEKFLLRNFCQPSRGAPGYF
jgi:hypothetical protein